MAVEVEKVLPPAKAAVLETGGLQDSRDCVRCGACMSSCPLYALTGRETAVARGKLQLLSFWKEGHLASVDRLREILSFCLLCGACADKCAVGLKVPELVKEARARIHREQGLVWHPELLLARLTWQAPHLIPRVAPMAPLINRLKSWVGQDSGLMWRLFPPLNQALAGFPDLALRPFSFQAPRWLPGRGSLKIAFFVGCGLEALFPRAGMAFLAVCQRLGIEVIIPPGQGCCGLMAESVGERDLALAQTRRLVQQFSALPVDYVVSACASCAFQLKRVANLLSDTAEEKAARRLAAKVREASEFLRHEAAYHPGYRPAAVKVVFHDPCHLHRGQGIEQEPRELLREAKGESGEAAEKTCCGLGGAFGVLFPDLSRRLGDRRLQALRDTGAEVVATSCSGCLVQLARIKSPLKVVHFLELIA